MDRISNPNVARSIRAGGATRFLQISAIVNDFKPFWRFFTKRAIGPVVAALRPKSVATVWQQARIGFKLGNGVAANTGATRSVSSVLARAEWVSDSLGCPIRPDVRAARAQAVGPALRWRSMARSSDSGRGCNHQCTSGPASRGCTHEIASRARTVSPCFTGPPFMMGFVPGMATS